MNQQPVFKILLTMVAPSPTYIAEALSQFPEWLRAKNLEFEKNHFLTKSKKAIDIYISYPVEQELSTTEVKALLLKITQELTQFFVEKKIDFALQEFNPVTRRKKVFCSDMDSTMISNETLDDFARLAGVSDEVAKITKLGMAGKINFKESLTQRLNLLKGVNTLDFFDKAISLIQINPGAENLLATFNKFDVETILVSGGFRPMAEVVQKKLGFHALYCNKFDIQNNKLTGRYVGEMVTGEKKLEYLKNALLQKGLLFEHGCAIGDGANDLMMIKAAGLGVAYSAKSLVKQQVHASIEHTDLTSLLYFQGYHEEEFVIKKH